MKHLKKFSSDTDRIAYESGSDYIEPYVSLVSEDSSVHYKRLPPNYLRFTALEDDSELRLKKWDDNEGVELTPTVNIEYSYDGYNFIAYDFNEIVFSEGETVYLRGNNPNGFSSYDDNNDDYTWHHFTTPEGSFECHGNIMSLLYGADFDTSPNALVIPNSGCFFSLFYDSNTDSGCNIICAPELPATELSYDCYGSMFYNCTNIEKAPVLPATTLADNCYGYMFSSCTNLTTAPELPATTLAEYCYSQMFNGCTSLTTAPELTATTLTEGCYSNMFYGCTNLTSAPELPATTLAQGCYVYMFKGCTSLNYIKCLATDISASNCTKDWVDNVAATGTFTKHPSMNNWTTGDSGIPVGWTATDAFEIK